MASQSFINAPYTLMDRLSYRDLTNLLDCAENHAEHTKSQKGTAWSAFMEVGRSLSRFYELFPSIAQAFSYWKKERVDPLNEATVAETSSESEAEADTADKAKKAKLAKIKRERGVAFIDKLMDAMPGFHDSFIGGDFDDEVLDGKGSEVLIYLFRRMQMANDSSRQTDVKTLKRQIKEYILPDLTPEEKVLIGDITQKSQRGFGNPVLASYLIPIDLIARFTEDPQGICASLITGRIKITAQHFPAFAYPRGRIDISNLEEGLFKGELLIRVFKHIYVAPKAALNKNISVTDRSNFNVKRHSFDVTSHMVSYSFVQAYVAMSSMHSWGRFDGGISLEELYYHVISFFDGDSANPVWAKDTLEFYQNLCTGGDSAEVDENEGDGGVGAAVGEGFLFTCWDLFCSQRTQNILNNRLETSSGEPTASPGELTTTSNSGLGVNNGPESGSNDEPSPSQAINTPGDDFVDPALTHSRPSSTPAQLTGLNPGVSVVDPDSGVDSGSGSGSDSSSGSSHDRSSSATSVNTDVNIRDQLSFPNIGIGNEGPGDVDISDSPGMSQSHAISDAGVETGVGASASATASAGDSNSTRMFNYSEVIALLRKAGANGSLLLGAQNSTVTSNAGAGADADADADDANAATRTIDTGEQGTNTDANAVTSAPPRTCSTLRQSLASPNRGRKRKEVPKIPQRHSARLRT